MTAVKKHPAGNAYEMEQQKTLAIDSCFFIAISPRSPLSFFRQTGVSRAAARSNHAEKHQQHKGPLMGRVVKCDRIVKRRDVDRRILREQDQKIIEQKQEGAQAVCTCAWNCLKNNPHKGREMSYIGRNGSGYTVGMSAHRENTAHESREFL